MDNLCRMVYKQCQNKIEECLRFTDQSGMGTIADNQSRIKALESICDTVESGDFGILEEDHMRPDAIICAEMAGTDYGKEIYFYVTDKTLLSFGMIISFSEEDPAWSTKVGDSFIYRGRTYTLKGVLS